MTASAEAATIHTAAAAGQADLVRQFLDADPDLVHARGRDGGHPLHFATTVDVARVLVEGGAQVDARDEDHHSTPAQWRIGDAPEVARFLLEHGAALDLFLAVGLDDLDWVRRAVEADPSCTSQRIGNNAGPFPGIGYRGTGGTILQWTLGFNASPHEIAHRRGQQEIYRFLRAHTPARPLLLVACMVGDEALARSILAAEPDLTRTFEADDLSLLARACWETNHNYRAARIMLDLGFPVDVPEPNHGHTPLHNAAFDGHAPLVKLLIERGHPVDVRDPRHQATPLDWCLHAATEARRHDHDYAGAVDHLLSAGAAFEPSRYPVGHDSIDAVLRRHLDRGPGR